MGCHFGGLRRQQSLPVDSCVEGTGCQYEPFQCAQVSDCFAMECVGDDGFGGPLCNTTTPVDCDDKDSCTIDECQEGLGCIHLPHRCEPTTECNYPVGCDGSGPDPICILTNITSLFDFCGICRGDNVACFFSSVVSTPTIAGISGGVAAGIAIAAICA